MEPEPQIVRRRGRPTRPRVAISVLLRPEQHRQLQALADRLDRSQADLIRGAVDRLLQDGGLR